VETWWTSVADNTLHQGDYLPGCIVPSLPDDFASSRDKTGPIPLLEMDLIVLTQSCDLANANISLVTLCAAWTVEVFEEESDASHSTSRKQWVSKWNNVRKGRQPALHLLQSPTTPDDSKSTLVVDFRQSCSLPIAYLTQRASQPGQRWRLKPPYLEHLSQSLARFYMRVGLPSPLPEFK
jgi:hypothetical protein